MICPGVVVTALGPQQVVSNRGDPDCGHRYIHYVDNEMDGQAWWCDLCKRHEKMPYAPGVKMTFPSGAYIRSPNKSVGGAEVYAWQANDNGVVDEPLPNEKRIRKKDLEARLGKTITP